MAETSNLEGIYPEELVIPLELPNKKIVSFDMGGSLFKIAYTEPGKAGSETKINMRTFVNKDVKDALYFIRDKVIGSTNPDDVIVIGSGIGSRTQQKLFDEILPDKKIVLTDEFTAFSKGFAYMLKNLPEETFLHKYNDKPIERVPGMFPPLSKRAEGVLKEIEENNSLFPALLCFCGSGLAYLLVEEDGSTDLLGGSWVSGMLFNGLGTYLTGAKDYKELLDMARRGDASTLNMSLEDFSDVKEYGDVKVEKFKEALAEGIVSEEKVVFENFYFGKVIKNDVRETAPENLARALLHVVAGEIMSDAACQARSNRVKKCYFAGTFFKDNEIAKDYIKNRICLTGTFMGAPTYSRFLKFEGYTGVLGAIIAHVTSL